MHDHNKDGGGKGMMWMMIPCLFLLGILFLGGGKLFSSSYLGPILIGAMVIAHVWMMYKGHGGHSSDHEDSKNRASGEPKNKDEHQHGGINH